MDIHITTITLLSVTCNFCCTFHTGADQGARMVQKTRQVNLGAQGFVLLAQERWEVCWSLHQMVVLCADGAGASQYYGWVEGLALSCQMVLGAPLCCRLLSRRWHLDGVGRAALAVTTDRYGSRNIALLHASAAPHGSSDLHHIRISKWDSHHYHHVLYNHLLMS